METANKNDNLDHFAVKRKDLFSTILYICIGIFLVVILLFLLYLLLGKKVGQTPKEEPDQVVELPQTGSLEEGGTVEGTLNLDGNKIINVGPAQQDSDAISRGSADERFVNVTGDTMIGDLTISGGKDLILASSGDLLLNDTYLNESTSPTDSGAFLIGVYDEFDNSNSTNVQDVLDNLDLVISTSAGGYTETDPIFSASPAHSITNTNISHWNTAYSWGNHALAGYLTSESSDPVFSASPSAGITSGNISNWSTAYSWGNHAAAGYFTSESDPVWASAEPNYFNLSQNETVNGIPAFNGGDSSNPPFTVDSNYIVSNLNSDFLDSQEGSYFLNASNINSGSLGTSYYSAYNDLSVENYLNNDSDSDLLIRSQADSRLVNDASGEINNSNDFNFPSSTFISNLDTDYLDGQHGSYYLNASNINSGTLGNSYFSAYSNLFANSYVPASSSTIWTDTNDGTGSSLDADTLDGSSFMYASTDDWVDEVGDIISGTLTFSSVATDINVGSNEDLTLSAPGNGHIVLLPDTGNVGIGTTSPSDFKLQVNGSIGPSSAPTISSITQTLTTVDSTASVGWYTSLAIGTDGLPVISYYSITGQSLKVIKCGNTSCSSSNTITTIDSASTVGQYNSVVVGTDGLPIISYDDTANGDLKVAKCGNASCSSGNTVTTVDSTDDVGPYTSSAIGSDGLPVISYYDETNGDLKVVKCGNASCSSGNTITIVESTNDVGWYTSIAVGTDGLPVISHWDLTNSDLRVVKCGNIFCSSNNIITTLDSTGDVGTFTSIAIGTDSLPIISYHYYSTRDLRVVKCGNTSCSAGNTITTVDATDDVGGWFTSITIGTDGLPIISYYNETTGDLKVAKCGNTSCSSVNTITTVDSTNQVGRYSSIAIGTDGLPVISYCESSNLYLKIAKCATENCANTSGSYFNGGSDIGSMGKYFNNVYAVNYWAKEGMQISNFDLAEDYEAVDPSITAGDVVAPAYGSNISIDKTNFPYQSDVIGVVSTEPGVRLSDWSLSDEERTQMRPVSLAGRVPVKVTTDNGPIKKGDFLVSSSKPGYAMKACGTKYCKAGTVIGKALEDFDPYNSGNSPQVTEEISTLSLDPSAYEEDTIMMFVNLSWYNPPSTITLSSKTISNDAYSSFWDGNLDTIDTLQISTNLTAREGVFQYIKVDSINVENLDVTGLLTSREIKAGVLKAFDGENIIIKLSDTLGKTALKIQNSLGKTVFSIDSTGKLTIKADVENSSVGKGTIKAGKTSVRINTKSVTNNSKVFTSPTVTSNAQRAVVEKVENKYFRVSIQRPLSYDLTFDWWLIN